MENQTENEMETGINFVASVGKDNPPSADFSGKGLGFTVASHVAGLS